MLKKINLFIVLFGNKFLKTFKDISIEYDKIIFCYVEDSKLIEKVKGKENNIVFYTEGKFYLIILKLYLENFIIPYNHHLIQIFNQYFSDKVINVRVLSQTYKEKAGL